MIKKLAKLLTKFFNKNQFFLKNSQEFINIGETIPVFVKQFLKKKTHFLKKQYNYISKTPCKHPKAPINHLKITLKILPNLLILLYIYIYRVINGIYKVYIYKYIIIYITHRHIYNYI